MLSQATLKTIVVLCDADHPFFTEREGKGRQGEGQ